MADSDFWRDLAKQFGETHIYDLCARWEGEGESRQWELSGGTPASQSAFRALAVRAGKQFVASTTAQTYFDTWLNEATSQDRGSKVHYKLDHTSPKQVQVEYGLIEAICKVSETHCHKLEIQALEAEPAEFAKIDRAASRPRPRSHAVIANEEQMRVFARRAAEEMPLPEAFLQKPASSASVSPTRDKITENVESPTEARKRIRRAFAEPLLLKKGWSPFDWSTESEVAHATVMDYLDGKTNPFNSTRLKLANGLGVDPEGLPK